LHKKYLLNAEEKLEAAEYLFEGKFYSDAVSRAYYSMFYSAKLLLSIKELYPRTHKGVISQFGLEFVKTGFMEDVYGRALTHAKDRREIADYDLEKDFTPQEAEAIIDDARRFLDRVKEAIQRL
jgi:uncharacterized protein (UPF0332 family)